jgi:hypothetical protein
MKNGSVNIIKGHYSAELVMKNRRVNGIKGH